METQTLIRLVIGLTMTAIVGVFALKRVLYLTNLIRSGQPTADERGRKNHLGERIGNQVREVFGQTRLLKWSIPGIAHFFTMWGFFVLATVYLEAYGVLFNPKFHLPVVGKWGILGFLQDFFAVAVLLGIIAFAMVSAAGKVLTHLQGGAVPPVRLDGLGWYFSAMVVLNLWLWRVFAQSWNNSGRNSDMLRGMAISARFDALISAGTGLTLLGAPLLLGTPLAPLMPIADSLLVLVLCAALLGEPIAILKGAVAEAAGSSRSLGQDTQITCANAIVPALKQQGCELLELAMIRLGRTVTAVAYVEPENAMTAGQVDDLRLAVEQQLVKALQTPVLCEVIPTAVHPYAEAAH